MPDFADSAEAESQYPKPRRRMSDHKIDALANSAVFKIAQGFVTLIILPLIGWVGATVLDRLNSIEKSIQAAQITSATMELRVQALERRWDETKPGERLILLEHELKTRIRP